MVLKGRADQLPIIEQYGAASGSRFSSAAFENPINKAKGLFWPYVEKLKKRTPVVQPRSSEPAWVPPAERQEKTSLLLPGEDQSLRVKVARGEDQSLRVKVARGEGQNLRVK
ncbi:MAG: hypothetical protein VX288_03155, partial [Planctomycetota bacterium]|nr:hypothetical protein [Planctomycetota bacterium]